MKIKWITKKLAILKVIILTSVLLGISVIQPHPVVSQGTGGKMYWTDQAGIPRIQRANLDGTGIENIISAPLSPSGIALDVAGSKMYWIDDNSNKIQCANLDGSDIQDLVTTGLYLPRGIALDTVNSKIYWTDAGTHKIQRANLDGTNVEDLVIDTDGILSPKGIALDTVNSKIYWTDAGTHKIQRANLDGTNVEDLITGISLNNSVGMALDVDSNKMYWTNSPKIQRANFDGTVIEDLIIWPSGSSDSPEPFGIALDVADGKMYWADIGTNMIQRANLDGTDIEDLVTGLGNPLWIALAVDTDALEVCTSGCAYSLIQDAIDAASDGDTVLVGDGIYVENINFLGKAITVTSLNGAATTIIDGDVSGSVVTFGSGEGPDSVLDGFTIQNGSASNGSGIYCLNSSPTITNCTITGNSIIGSRYLYGGGIYCKNSSPMITNCTICNNRTSWGGGIYCYSSSSPTITNCTITNNTASGTGGCDGGGIYCTYSSSPTITNCTISDNTSNRYGGGIGVYSSTPTLVNNILWGNIATSSGNQIYVHSGSCLTTYSDIEDGWTGIGNINADPLFVGSGDYHLTMDSPCINTGTVDGAPADDIDGDIRPQGGGYDIGSDEYHSGDPNDVDGDGVLNDVDNCPDNANPDQLDLDHDGIGNVCDDDRDGDGVLNDVDNCPDLDNPLQNDEDNDGIGNACDTCINVDFSSSTELNDNFITISEELTPVWLSPGYLKFDLPSSSAIYRNATDQRKNYYAYAPGNELVCLDEGEISIRHNLENSSNLRAPYQIIEILLYDPSKNPDDPGGFNNPYVRAKTQNSKSSNSPAPYSAPELFALDVLNGDIGIQADTRTYPALYEDSKWWTNALTFTASANGGYDITFSAIKEGDAVSYTYTDYTTESLSGLAVGIGMHYYEWYTPEGISSSAYGLVDDFSICNANNLEVDPDDLDGDGIPNSFDNCPNNANPDQLDLDHDDVGNVCDDDRDGDGFSNEEDNCPDSDNPLQHDGDNDGIGDACDEHCNPALTVKQGWVGSQSSWWLQPWGNTCDGKAQNAIDGIYKKLTYSRDYWNCTGDLSPRSFFAPRYTGQDVGEWMQIGFPETYTINGITMTQAKERMYVSGLVRPNKYTAYLKDATIIFSDGSTLDVTFPPEVSSKISFPAIATESVRIIARSFYGTTTTNPAWFVMETDFSGAPGDVDLNLEICYEDAPLPPDDDQDGVPDYIDEFPTDETEWIDSDDDGIGDNADPDDDNDGVPDDQDTSPGEDDSGEDSDEDGMTNQNDTDDDNDGVLDTEDAFPLDPSESSDRDGDGVGDNADNCPDDPNKTDPGVCGCGVSDVDSDGDGISDCNDNCPDNPNHDQGNVDGDQEGDVCDICPDDSTNTCNPDRSAGGSIGPTGGTISTPDGSVTVIVPPGALNDDTSLSITETDTSFELTTNLGNGFALFGVSIQPEGLEFNTPITIIFAWADENNDGKVDGTNIKERNLIITKDNVAVTGRCGQNSGCDMPNNTFTFEVSSLSEFALVFVDDVGPITSNVLATPNPAPVNTEIILTASVDDSETGESTIGSAEYNVDGGDYIPMSAQDGNFDSMSEVVVTNLAFAEAGVHSICIRGWDTFRNVEGAEECILLAVYDPEGGFVTGGGWINSPAGAYAPDPDLTGKANFGFVSKYKKGATVPTGQTEFQFKVADMNFKSDSYDWLVVAGPKAMYKGAGTINGGGDYGFMLSAIDEELTPSTDVDLFRIKIWDKNNDEFVYDNQMGDTDDAEPTTEVQGGSIKIHKGDQ